MRIFLKHIIRNIKENVGRTFLIIISLFGVGLLLSVSLSLIFSIKSLWNSLSNSVTGGYNFIVSSVTEEKISIDRIKSTKVEFDYLGVSDYDYGYIKNNKGEFISTPLIGLDIQQSLKMKMIEFEKIQKDLVLNDNEIIVSNSVAKKYKLKENNKIQYYDENGNVYDLVIKYIAKDSGAFLHELSFVSNEQTFLKIIGEEKIPYDYFCLKYKGTKNISALANELNNIEDDYGLDFVNEKVPNLNVIFGDDLKILIIALMLILVIVFFSLNSIVKIIVSERIPVIGSFRSVGASVKKMNAILLLEMAIYGVIGGALGASAGIAFNKLLFLAFEMLSGDLGIAIKMESFEIYSFLIFVLTIIILIIFQISLSISEILKSSKLSIKDCIFNKHESIYKYSINKLLFGLFFLTIGIVSLIFIDKLTFTFCVISILSLFIAISILLPFISKYFSKVIDKIESPVLCMAKNTIVNNKLQINTNIIVAVMICISLISFTFLNYSISNYRDKLDMVKSELYIVSSYEPMNVTNDIRAINNVERVSVLYDDDLATYYDSVSFANNKVDNLTILYSDNYRTLLQDSNLLELDASLADNLSDNEIIVSEYFRDKYKLKIGDVVVVSGINEEEDFNVETPLNLKVVGFADTSKVNDMSIILSESIVEDVIQTFSNQQYFIQVLDEKNLKEIRKELLRNLTYQTPEIYSQKEYIETTEKAMENLYKGIIEIILIIIGIALIGIISNQTVSFFERKKEMAILYSTSMSRNQLNKMIFIEIILSYFISALVSIIFTLMLTKLLKHTLSILGLNMPISFSIVSILVLLFTIGIIMLVIYLVMKRKIKKMNIVEELKYE